MGSCSEAHPWIDVALDKFFARAESRSIEGLGLSEVLSELRGRDWSNHRPGKLEVTIHWNNPENDMPTFTNRTINRPNTPYKPAYMYDLLERAVGRYHAEVARELGRPSELTLFLQTEDYPNQLPMHASGREDIMRKWVLPIFSMCSTDDSTDVPVPDFTYVRYAESGRKEAWDRMRRKIGAAAAWHTPWRERKPALLWRGALRAGGHSDGPREVAAAQLTQFVGPKLRAQGVKLDLADAGGRYGGSDSKTMSREDQCGSRYLLHLRGTTYSASLRYQLLCGSPVAAVLGDENGECREFFLPALEDGKHLVKLPPSAHAKANVLLNLTSSSPAALARAARIGVDGQRFVLEELADDVLDCFWARALIRYGKRVAQLRAAESRGAAAAGSLLTRAAGEIGKLVERLHGDAPPLQQSNRRRVTSRSFCCRRREDRHRGGVCSRSYKYSGSNTTRPLGPLRNRGVTTLV